MKDMNWPDRVAYLENQLADSDRDNVSLRARLAEAERDAARYRWLRNTATTSDWCNLGGLTAERTEEEIDRAIADSADVCTWPACGCKRGSDHECAQGYARDANNG